MNGMGDKGCQRLRCKKRDTRVGAATRKSIFAYAKTQPPLFTACAATFLTSSGNCHRRHYSDPRNNRYAREQAGDFFRPPSETC